MHAARGLSARSVARVARRARRAVLTLFVLPVLYRALARWQVRHTDQEEERALAEALRTDGALVVDG